MAEVDWFVAGLITGILVGVSIGWLLAQTIAKPASVIFERDKEGKISGIHYVPAGAKA